ncbi:hypothetical protein [Streptosporangium saharense]|uniref:DUF7927 domain-containing protein n=1 Tax=Streptosporangium saharense TaxID=1706840 RepID=UPI00344107A6
MRIVKTAAPLPVRKGARLLYMITVVNEGDADDPDVTVTDDLSGLLDDADYGGDGAAPTGTVAYDAPKLTWTGPVGAGEVVTITYSVTTHGGGDGNLRSELTGPPSASTVSNCVSEGCEAPLGMAELRIVRSSEPAVPKLGEPVRYTIRVTNVGTAPYQGASFTDDLSGLLDDATFGDDLRASDGDASYSPPTVLWNGDVDPGKTVTVTYSARTHLPATGDRKLGGIVVSEGEGTNCPRGSVDPRCGDPGGQGVPELTVTRKAEPATPRPGQTVAYTVTFENTGTGRHPDARYAVDLSGVLDGGTYRDDATATTGTVTYGRPVLEWRGDLSAGEKATITYSVVVGDPSGGDPRQRNVPVEPPVSRVEPVAVDDFEPRAHRHEEPECDDEACFGPVGPRLPYTGFPMGVALLGLTLCGLGVAVRLSARLRQ